MAIKSQSDIVSSINADISDNNAQAISAEDVRSNMVDIVESINTVVGSGDHDATFPFVNNVRASKENGNGFFIAESGVKFPNAEGGETIQYTAYPGPGGIDHDDLQNRNNSNAAHTQYLTIDGTRPMEENLPMGTHWINASGAGTDNKGISFSDGAVNIGSGDSIAFADGSKVTNGRGVAKSWLNFDADDGGSPSIRSHHNVDELEKLAVGKYRVYMPSGTVKDANFAVIGLSNSRSTASSQEDFARNTVGITQRGVDGSGRPNFTFLVLNEEDQYIDADINDIVVYGYDEGESVQAAPTITTP